MAGGGWGEEGVRSAAGYRLLSHKASFFGVIALV